MSLWDNGRWMRSRWLHLVAVLIFLAAPALVAAAPTSPLVRVELLSEVRSIAPGATFWVALRQRITPGWHTYWVNPGDSGEPLSMEWSLPAGLSAGEIAWPYPARIPQGPAMSYGYTGEVVLPIRITTAPDLRPGTHVTLRGRASWIVCEKICIPEESSLALTLPIASGAAKVDPAGAAAIAATRRALPTSSPWDVSFTATSDTVRLAVAAPGRAAERMAEVSFYPARWGAIEHSAPQRFRAETTGFTLELARGPLRETVKAPIDGVLVVAERLDAGVSRQAFTVRAEPRALGGGTHALSILRALVLALAGGVVLNLMPCVLPVLSMKAFGLVQHASGRPVALRLHGLAYTAGVLASFAVVAGVLLTLRAGGEQLGWGFQLQSPVFVTILALVLFAVALSLSGMIVIGSRWSGAGQALAGRAGYAGSFFTVPTTRTSSFSNQGFKPTPSAGRLRASLEQPTGSCRCTSRS